MEKDIIIKGAREHNLKNIDVKNTTRKSLSYLRGFRAPVKSSLAFDTIYAEGQRRYVESLVVICKNVSRSNGKARCRLY